MIKPRFHLRRSFPDGSECEVGPAYVEAGSLEIPAKIYGERLSLASRWYHAQRMLWHLAATRVILACKGAREFGSESDSNVLCCVACVRENLEAECEILMPD